MTVLNQLLVDAVTLGKNIEKVVQLISEGASANAVNHDGELVLQIAIHHEKIALVSALLAHGADPNLAEATADEPSLAAAARTGMVDMVSLLIKFGATIHPDALIAAVHCEHEGVIRLLLQHKPALLPQQNISADEHVLLICAEHENLALFELLLPPFQELQQPSIATMTLSAAALLNQEKTVLALLKKDFPTTFEEDDSDWLTPLMAAVRVDNTAIMQLLIAHGATVAIDDLLQKAFIFNASSVLKLLLTQPQALSSPLVKQALVLALFGKDIETCLLLLDAGVEIPHSSNSKAFMLLMRTNRVPIAASLLDAGVDVNARLSRHHWEIVTEVEYAKERDTQQSHAHSKGQRYDNSGFGKTMLMIAVEFEQLEMATFLLTRGVDIDAQDINQETALYMAAKADSVAMVKLLLENGANPNVTNYEGLTPTFMAGCCQDALMIQLMKKHGGDITYYDSDCDPIIRYSLINNAPKVTHWLLAQGEQLPTVFSDGYPAIIAAALGDCGEMVRYLHARGDDIHARWPERDIDALMRAAEEGLVEMVTLLLTLGANPTAVNQHGESALSLTQKAHRTLYNEGSSLDLRPYTAVCELLTSKGAAADAVPAKRTLLKLCHAITAQLKECMPPLDVDAMLESLPDEPSEMLDWLDEALSSQRLMEGEDSHNFYGELPEALQMLSDIDLSAFNEDAINEALEQYGYPALPSEVPYFEYQNHFLNPHGLCMVTLPLEDIYMMVVIDDPAALKKLQTLFKQAGLPLIEYDTLDIDACIEVIKEVAVTK